MGKQPRSRPAAGSEEERTRELIRELHETIKEGREVTRELRAAEADAGLVRVRLEQSADHSISRAETVIRALFEAAARRTVETTEDFNARFRAHVADLADVPTGTALVDQIANGIGTMIRPLVDEAIGKAMEHRLNQLIPLTDQDPEPVRLRRRRSG